MTESKFRERRSAYREEDEAPSESPEPQAPTPEVPPAAAAERSAPPEPRIDAGPGASAEEPEGAELPGADLDQLAAMDVPPPSFLELVEPHIEMALRFLGQLPLTPDGERRVLPQWAKREIDLLGLLEERTRGNLPPEERQALDQALDQLRTLFLKVAP